MQNTDLKVISLNIEMDNHLDKVISFFNEQQPDIILLQEVLEKDINLLVNAIRMHHFYTKQNILCFDSYDAILGLLTLSKTPFNHCHEIFYRGNNKNLIKMTKKEPEKTSRALSMVEILKNNQPFYLINTHFTWSPDGKPNADQYTDLESILYLLGLIPEFILCGDFNAPRGTPIFDKIADHYTDNVPIHIRTTIDKNLHRAGDLGIVVDGVFTTPGYQVTDIDIINGLSDHCAIVATIQSI